MSHPMTITLACGCLADWDSRVEQYQHRGLCPHAKAQAAARRAARQKSLEEAYRRQIAPLNAPDPSFKMWR